MTSTPNPSTSLSSQPNHRPIKTIRSTFTTTTDGKIDSDVKLSVEILTLDDDLNVNLQSNLTQDHLITSNITHFALFAHPYGPLGGSSRDPVLRRLASHLVNLNWMVVLFDARGSGSSTGRTSWTTLPEAKDYQAILDQVLKPIILRAFQNSADRRRTELQDFTLLRGGYSHGAVIASASSAIILPEGAPKLHHRLLLISYPVSYLWALTSFKSKQFEKALEDQLISNQTDQKIFIIHGDRDQFTSLKAYQNWTDRLSSKLNRGDHPLKILVSIDTDHFWSEKHSKICEIVMDWINESMKMPM